MLMCERRSNIFTYTTRVGTTNVLHLLHKLHYVSIVSHIYQHKLAEINPCFDLLFDVTVLGVVTPCGAIAQ